LAASNLEVTKIAEVFQHNDGLDVDNVLQLLKKTGPTTMRERNIVTGMEKHDLYRSTRFLNPAMKKNFV
jgi:hypothetical protein